VLTGLRGSHPGSSAVTPTHNEFDLSASPLSAPEAIVQICENKI
jgi:hypothetical protein